MIRRTPGLAATETATVTASSLQPESRWKPSRPLSFFFLSAWCGLVAGLLEVGTFVLRKRLFDTNHFYGTTRNLFWLVPSLNLCIFLAVGAVACILGLIWTRGGRWIYLRLLCALTLLPIALIAFPQIYGLAWLLVALGVAARLVPRLERHARGFRRLVWVSFPLLVATVAIFWVSLWTIDRGKRAQAMAARLPPHGSPNVLLIVMDTVTAGHLSLYGYDRGTSKTLAELAERGIRFDSAQTASSWTLPSHAAMFTGHWMHELEIGWLTPLNTARPTVAEFLKDRGYATVGFVANTAYTASDSGLARGFTEYHDFIFPRLTVFKRAVLISQAMAGLQTIVEFLEDSILLVRVRPYLEPLWHWLDADRKAAKDVNRELLDWLSRRPQPERPFFAFLNYFDAHAPYLLPTGNYHRFGGSPTDTRQRQMIEIWDKLDKKALKPQDVAFAAKAYDECLADLDEQIGKLTDTLKRTGALDRTWLIVVADHGESFGEHTDVFEHGTSLYQTEVHVPLVIVPPGGSPAKQVVRETVSLRDLAATIVDLAGESAGAPFPGESLARFWDRTKPNSSREDTPAGSAFAEVVPNPRDPSNRDSAGNPRPTFPMAMFNDAEWTYIRREGNIREELYHLGKDAKQQHNLVREQDAKPTLERLRKPWAG